MSGQIHYSDKFKIDAVAEVTECGYPVKEVAERLGISCKSLYTWMAMFSKPKRHTGQKAEVRRLKKKLAFVTKKRDIPQKATAYIARDAK
ncbi:MAG: transposase [Hyphomicrobiales bacterium]